MIPREGGNRWSGDFKAAYRPGDWQASNLTDRHKAKGLTVGNAIDRIADYNASIGGPIKKDKLWVFTSARYFSVNNFIANTYMADAFFGHFLGVEPLELRRAAAEANRRVGAVGIGIVADVEVRSEL